MTALELKPLPPRPRPSADELEQFRADLPLEQQAYAGAIWLRELMERQPEAVIIFYSRHVDEWTRYGVTNYEGYLESDVWRQIKTRVLLRVDYRCAVRDCVTLANQVHHRSYDHATLAGRYDEYLVALCEHHHRLVHWTARGKYRDEHYEQEAALIALVAGEPLDPLTSDEWKLLRLAARRQGAGVGFTPVRGNMHMSPDDLIAHGLLEKVPATLDKDGPCGWIVRASPFGHAMLEEKARRRRRHDRYHPKQ